MRYTHLDSALILSVGLVYVYVARGTCCDLASLLVECDGFEVRLFVDICGLKDVVGAVEDDKRISGDVSLMYEYISY